MNILYIEHYAGSPEMGMEFRPYYLSREWVRMGHRVTILAGDYSHLRRKNPSVKKDFQAENIDGIEYVWLKTGSYSGNGAARALTIGRFTGKLLLHARRIVKQWKPELVIASSTYPLDTYPAQRIAGIADAEYVHEAHDMWPSTLYEAGGMSRKHPFVVAMQIAENSAYRHCDKCVSLMPYTKEYMTEHGLDASKWVNIQNGVVEEEWQDPEPVPEAHRSFFEAHAGKFIAGYFGGHAKINALDQLLDTAAIVAERDPEVLFVLVGEGLEKERLRERVRREGIRNVFFLPAVGKKAIPDLLKRFDCSYMTGAPSPLYRFGLCLNKMYDSMMAGIPVVCAFDAPDTLIRQTGCGFQCSPANPANAADAVCTLAAMDPKARKEMGLRGKRAVTERFTYRMLAREFLEQVKEHA